MKDTQVIKVEYYALQYRSFQRWDKTEKKYIPNTWGDWGASGRYKDLKTAKAMLKRDNGLVGVGGIKEEYRILHTVGEAVIIESGACK